MPAARDNQAMLILRPLASSDFPLLVQWINAPHVARWWDGTVDIEKVKEKYGPRLQADSPTSVFVIEVEQSPIGFIQCYRHSQYPDWEQLIGITNGAGIDYLIGDNHFTGKGLGQIAIKNIVEIAFNLYPEIDVVLSAPQKDNRASWRALEKAGFERVAEKQLHSDCPSDAGLSYIYALKRPQ
jgi:RimJ/RimL family protein N-acetyltransferase